MDQKRISKFLSLVLRHEPGKIGITLDAQGWTDIHELILAAGRHGIHFDRKTLAEIVGTNDKQRFALSEDGTRIRANQGHSVTVDLALVPEQPPEILYHGTVGKFLKSIRTTGLHKGERHHVHLSRDLTTATKVGQRRGAPVILSIRSAAMAEAGHLFFLSDNGVWLTDTVPPEFIGFP
ncbi:RNA 2'-phosphotransferase [Luteolibacter flavescens]|uniref:Probable RNA 2'-phosphotransferase n=1 Tax=Luteolibacter flavescens TaxID=1859460 RepID=A0ABT3FU37_9BACT|nr:RNA 2'-phosphotransferase [Luteolibacter flavescens]MCW1887098.1 RNA 2'-phosphotransferase [Luteolibacter flavescens]